jgi:hypothetical protein
MRTSVWSIALSLIVLASFACSLPIPGLGGAGEGPPRAGPALLSDDFSDPASGWEAFESDNGAAGYGDGVYVVTSYGGGDTIWGIAGRSFTDTDIEVEATQVRAPANDNNDYGVACRVQENGDGYYLLISGDGFYSILVGEQGAGFAPLVDWETSDQIRQGNARNTVRGICKGATLTLVVNGVQLASAQDGRFTQGDVALTATSYEAEETEIHFDNLTIRQP